MIRRNHCCVSRFLLFVFAVLEASSSCVYGFHPPLWAPCSSKSSSRRTAVIVSAASSKKKKGGYEPKWVKKETMAEKMGGQKLDYKDIGLKGTIPVVFQQGNVTKTTMALPGQPLRDAATQAGQFIKYGCGKGECGTCEAMCNGKWIRPCISYVPGTLQDGEEQYIVQVKEVQAKTVSSGKFFSARSFVLGFWNNLLGIVGFLKYRRNAKENWDERQEYEDLIRQKTLEKKRSRRLQDEQNNDNKISP